MVSRGLESDALFAVHNPYSKQGSFPLCDGKGFGFRV